MLSIRHLERLGGALRQLRDAACFTQAEVCARADLRRPQLSRWENGHEVPTLESLIKYLGAIGAGLADLERELIGEEDRDRIAAVSKEVRQIREDHQLRILSSSDLRSAVEEIMNAEAVDPELERLVEGLPKTVKQLLADPARRPAVIEELIEMAWAMRSEDDRQAYNVADATRLVAAELPASSGREQRFALRARSLELWGTMKRVVGEATVAEAALLCAFELLVQTEGAEPPDLAVILGRLAVVAGEHERRQDLARYAADAARVVKAADREWPLPAFLHLWQTVMSEPMKPAAGARVAEALFQAVRQAYGGFDELPWEMSLEITDRGEAGTEIRLERKGPAPGLPNRTSDEPSIVHCYPGRYCPTSSRSSS